MAHLKRPLFYILDEFANMPKIDGLNRIITVARSRGISFMLIIQALSQLNAKYTADVAKIISSNCNMQVFLASNDNETAEYFSKICGEKTTREKNVSISVDGSYEIRHLAKAIKSMVNQMHVLMNDIVVEQESKRKSELNALQAQINPHFLYNTLDSIVWMIENQNYTDAIKMVTALARLFRISLSKGENIIPLR